MYLKDGESYFVFDGHMHYWNAAPNNWVPGQEKFAKGWIEIEGFGAVRTSARPQTHRPLAKFQRYTEESLMHDLFTAGHVDVAIFQPTYLKEWHAEASTPPSAT